MTTFIYHQGNPNLAILLTQLQPQLDENDDIYVVDVTTDQSGVAIVKQYGTTRCYIFVEIGSYDYDTAKKYALQSMYENEQDGLLILSDRAFISNTLIANIKRSAKQSFDWLAPVITASPYSVMDTNFRWFNPPTNQIKNLWIFQEYCYFIKNDKLTDPVKKTGIMPEELVVVLPPPKPLLNRTT